MGSRPVQRLMLLELLSDDPLREFRTEAYPFLAGYARQRAVETLWLAHEAGREARAGGAFLVEPPAPERDALGREVERFRPDVLVVNDKPGPALAARLTEALGGAPLLGLADRSPEERSDGADLVRELGLPEPAAGPCAIPDLAVPDYACRVLGPLAAPHLARVLGPACAWNRRVAANPAFAGLLPEGDVRAGCAFCQRSSGPDLAVPVRTPTVPLALLQVRRFHETAPAERRPARFLVDSPPVFHQLPRFLEGVEAAGLPPSAFHFYVRIDEFLARVGDLERWLPRLAARGHSLHLLSMGLENFSPAENARFNKGIDGAQIDAAHREIERLEAAAPGTFVVRAHGGFSVILYTPWTTPEDLGTNARQMRAHRWPADHFGLAQRLRLLPSTPLALLARRDGLLAEGFSSGAWVAADCFTEWNQQELPWRFRDPQVAAIHAIMVRVRRDGERADDELGHRVAAALGRAHPARRSRLEVLEALLDCCAQPDAPAEPAALLDRAAALLEAAGAPDDGAPRASEPEPTPPPAPPPPPAPAPARAEPPDAAVGLEGRAGTLRIRFHEPAGGEHLFFAGAARPDDRLFRRVGPVGLLHTTPPGGDAFQEAARIVVDAATTLARPPTPDDRGRWARALRDRLARSPLAGRWACEVDEAA